MKQLTKKRIAAPFLALAPILVLLAAIVIAITNSTLRCEAIL